MRRSLLLISVIGAIVATLVALPLAASAESQHRLTLSVRYNLNPGPPITGTGTWAACCAIDDAGTTQGVVNITGMKNDYATIEGTHTFQSPRGTFSDVYKGTLGPLSSVRQIAEGHAKLLGGTGAYANVRGTVRFTVVVDGATGTGTGIHEGHMQLGKG